MLPTLLVYFFLLVLLRVIASGSCKEIGPHVFANWGAHYDHMPFAYLTAAAAVGMSRQEVTSFLTRLDKALCLWKKKFSYVSSVGSGPITEAAALSDTSVPLHVAD